MVREAVVKIQSHARRWLAMRRFQVRRKGLAAALKYWRYAGLKSMWGYWRDNATAASRHRRLLAASDAKRRTATRKRVFRAW